MCQREEGLGESEKDMPKRRRRIRRIGGCAKEEGLGE
jgi:hypothetical protein